MSGAITAGTLATVAGIGAAGSIGGALIGSNAAGNAASAQEKAANNAAQLQYQAGQNALDFQKQQWNTTQQNQAPWLQSGTGALSNLNYLLGISPMTSQQFTGNAGTGAPSPTGQPLLPAPGGNGGTIPQAGDGGLGAPRPSPMVTPQGGPIVRGGAPSLTGGPTLPSSGTPAVSAGPTGAGVNNADGNNQGAASGGFGSLMKGYGQTLQAPDLNNTTDPGYQARLQLGTDAVQRSAAARGNVLTGGTAKALDTYGQDYASNEYNNVYNRALQGYNTNYNVWNNDQSNQFNRLASLAGVGQTAANQLSTAGQNASNNVSSNLLNTAQNMGQQYNNAAAANASGIVGGANAWGGALSGVGSNLSNLLLLSQLGGGNYGGAVGSAGALPTGWA